MIQPTDYPIVFISHKHVDHALAKTLADFLCEEARYTIDIHNSSAPGYLQPETGSRLTEKLRDVLWRTHVLILLYTSAEHDWSWCMWEAGVANDSRSPDTRFVVFHCESEPPGMFEGQVNVNIRKEEESAQVRG